MVAQSWLMASFRSRRMTTRGLHGKEMVSTRARRKVYMAECTCSTTCEHEKPLKVSNQETFGTVSISARKRWRFEGNINYVPPPAAWQLSGADAAHHAHLNFKINKIALSSYAHGIIGQTSRVKYDADGRPVMQAEDKDGKGLIDGVASDYELDDLLSTQFKFSVFDTQEQGVSGSDFGSFTENKLNAEASKIFNV